MSGTSSAAVDVVMMPRARSWRSVPFNPFLLSLVDVIRAATMFYPINGDPDTPRVLPDGTPGQAKVARPGNNGPRDLRRPDALARSRERERKREQREQPRLHACRHGASPPFRNRGPHRSVSRRSTIW